MIIQSNKNFKSDNEKGNVFFYILLAIALFAALSYALSKGGRSSSSTLTNEQARIAAQEIIDYGNDIANAVQKLRLRGCSDNEISFENDEYAGYVNPNSPADERCHVFSNSGGQITYHGRSKDWFTPGYYSSWWVNGETSVVDVGSAESELIVWSVRLKEKLCMHLNKSLNNLAPSNENVSIHTTEFIGSYGGLPNGLGDDTGQVYKGKLAGCAYDPSQSYYYFYQVLIAR